MEDKKNMCTCGDVGGCGHCGGNLMGLGKHHHLTRALLYLVVLLFVFWIGLGLGELKGYLRYAPFDSGYNMYPPAWMMRQNTNKSFPALGTSNNYDSGTQSPMPVGTGR